LNGASVVTNAGATTQALTDDDTNYIYLTAAGVLTVNITGFPTYSATPHIRLATIAVGSESAAAVSSEYAPVDITDWRDTAFLAVGAGVSPADQQDLTPTLTITAAAEAAHARAITIQAKDAGGNVLAERCAVNYWVSTTAYGAPTATGTDTFGAPSAGGILRTHTAKADYFVQTDATGACVFELTHNDAGSSRYIMAEIDGKICASGEIAFDAV